MKNLLHDWRLKSAIQRGISWLPRSDWWNEQFQRHLTGGFDLTAEGECSGKLNCCQTHFANYQQFRSWEKDTFTAVEIGTGWFPIIPIGLFLCGASEIWTFDIVRLLRPDTFKRTLDCLEELDQNGALAKILPELRPERLARVRGLLPSANTREPAALLEELNIHAVIGSVQQASLPDESVDLVFSNGVLEHLTRPQLTAVLAEFRRINSSDGVSSHFIGLLDQYASFDPTITPYNFLQFSERSWRYWNNAMIPLNRLRVADYRELVKQAGFDIVAEKNLPGSLEDLRRIKLAPEFQRYSTEDLLVLFSWLVAKPAVNGRSVQSHLSE